MVKVKEDTVNNFDKLSLGLSLSQVEFKRGIDQQIGKGIGFSYKKKGDMLNFIFSGKLNAKPDHIGYCLDEPENLLSHIYNKTGLKIDEECFFNEATVYTVHTTCDVFTDDDPCQYISECRELFKANTDKYDIYRYANQKYINGLAVVPKTKERHRFIIYNKGIELRQAQNKDYREIFSGEYLEKTRNMLRFEYQIRDFKRMRKEFGIPKYEDPTIAGLLACNRNIVADFFQTLVKKED